MTDAPRAFHEKNITLANGLTIHYYEWPGPRPNLVLLHPSSGYGRMWEATAGALGSRFHVYALDQRGHGDSGRPDGDYSAEEYADDLYLFFREVGLDRAIVAAQGLAGWDRCSRRGTRSTCRGWAWSAGRTSATSSRRARRRSAGTCPPRAWPDRPCRL